MSSHRTPYFSRTPGMSRTGRALRLVQEAAVYHAPVESHVAVVLCMTEAEVTRRFTSMVISNYPGFGR